MKSKTEIFINFIYEGSMYDLKIIFFWTINDLLNREEINIISLLFRLNIYDIHDLFQFSLRNEKKEVSFKPREVSETVMHIELNILNWKRNGIIVWFLSLFSFYRNNQSSSSSSNLVSYHCVYFLWFLGFRIASTNKRKHWLLSFFYFDS